MIAGLLGFCSTILFVTCFQYEFNGRRCLFAAALLVASVLLMDGPSAVPMSSRWD